MAYKRARNLRDILCHSQLPRPVKNHSSRPCMRFNCNHCENIISDKEIVSTSTGHKHKIIGNNTCQTRNVVYAITCPVCRSQYVGKQVATYGNDSPTTNAIFATEKGTHQYQNISETTMPRRMKSCARSSIAPHPTRIFGRD